MAFPTVLRILIPYLEISDALNCISCCRKTRELLGFVCKDITFHWSKRNSQRKVFIMRFATRLDMYSIDSQIFFSKFGRNIKELEITWFRSEKWKRIKRKLYRLTLNKLTIYFFLGPDADLLTKLRVKKLIVRSFGNIDFNKTHYYTEELRVDCEILILTGQRENYPNLKRIIICYSVRKIYYQDTFLEGLFEYENESVTLERGKSEHYHIIIVNRPVIRLRDEFDYSSSDYSDYSDESDSEDDLQDDLRHEAIGIS